MDFNKRFKLPKDIQTSTLVEAKKNWVIDKFYGLDHLVNRLYIHWDLLSKCNYDCSYCYAKRFYKSINKWGFYSNFDIQKHIIKCISYSKLPVFLGLQGGEPTIDKNFYEIINLINTQILNNHIDNRLYITSNISNDKLLRLKTNNKTFILASFHPEFADAKHFVNVIKDLNFKTRVNLMLINEPKYWDILHFVYNELKHTQSWGLNPIGLNTQDWGDPGFWNFKLQIHPHFVYTDHSRGKLDNYSKEFYKEFEYMRNDSKEFIIETKTWDNPINGNSKEDVPQSFVMSDYEVFENDLHHFYGFKCYNNNHEIDFEGNTKVLCKETKVNLLDNPLYFRNLETINPIICPHQNCNCDGLLKTLKIR